MSSFRKPVIVTRTTPGHYDDTGIWVEGAPSAPTIRMSIQPLKANEMDALPEGRRNSRAVKIYADSELLPADQDTGRNGDLVPWLGKTWEVVSCMPYQCGVLPHYKAVATEVKAN